MLQVTFCDSAEDSRIKYAVIAARYDGRWVFCKHKDRSTYEMPGGHREPGEPILRTAERELYEETGAADFTLTPLGLYKVEDYGMLYLAEIRSFGALPAYEMEKIVLCDDLPESLTYPSIQPALFEKAREYLSEIGAH